MIKILSALLLLSSTVTHAATSLDFGGKGTHLDSKIKVFRKEVVGCKNCIYFGVLIDDRLEPLIEQYVSEILLRVRAPKAEKSGNFVSFLDRKSGFKAVNKDPASPVLEEFFYDFPLSEGVELEDLRFELLALQNRCVSKTDPKCRHQIVAVEGFFTAKDVQALTVGNVSRLALY
jgi:hypothetical protein